MSEPSVIHVMPDPPHVPKTITIRTRIVIVREARRRWVWSVEHNRYGRWTTVKHGKSWFRSTAWYDARLLIERDMGRMERWEAEIAVETQRIAATSKAKPPAIPAKHFDG